MFLKINTRKRGSKTYYYAELVEGYRENGKVKHKRISYIGAVDFDTANRLKKAFSDKSTLADINNIKFNSSVEYGNFRYIINILKELNLFNSFKKSFKAVNTHITVNTALEYIQIMILHRIIEPGSKLSLIEWLEHTPYKHFFNTNFNLQSLYRSLEVLEKNSDIVFKALYDIAINEFNQNRKELFYDITSSYMEGHKCIIAQYGYSRDHRGDKEQIVIGLVTTYDGFPIKCKIYKGNTTDKTTVSLVVKEIKEQFNIDEFVFVGDRGMLTESNIEEIKKEKQKYIMAIPRDWTKKYLEGITIDERSMKEIKKDELYSKFIEVEDNKEEQFLLCLNTTKRVDDRNYREKVLIKLNNKFDELNEQTSNTKTRIKTKEDLISKAAVIKKKKYGKYFNLEYIEEPNNTCKFKVKYTLNKEKIDSDRKLDGTFLIRTNTLKYKGEELIHIYKNLNEVEKAFKIIKNDLNIRPMYHWKEERVKGHVYMCVLSYFIINTIKYKLEKTQMNLTPTKLLNKLRKISLIEMQVTPENTVYNLTEINKKDKEVFDKINIKIFLPKNKQKNLL